MFGFTALYLKANGQGTARPRVLVYRRYEDSLATFEMNSDSDLRSALEWLSRA
jgi:hypothetical protein